MGNSVRDYVNSKKKKYNEDNSSKSTSVQDYVSAKKALYNEKASVSGSIRTEYDGIIKDYNDSLERFTNGYGQKAFAEEMTVKRLATDKIMGLKRKIESSRSYLGSEEADSYLTSLDDILAKYGDRGTVAQTRSKYETKAAYDDAVEQAEWYDKYSDMDAQARKDAIAKLKAGNGAVDTYGPLPSSETEASRREYNWLKGYDYHVTNMEYDVPAARKEIENDEAALARYNELTEQIKQTEQRLTLADRYLDVIDKEATRKELEALYAERDAISITSGDIAAKRLEANQAEDYQALQSYNALMGNADFKTVSEEGKKNKDNIVSSTRPVSPTSLSDNERAIRYMSDDEKNLYSYILQKQGAEEADKYLSALTDILNKRAASATYAFTGDSDTLKTLYAIPAGLDQFKSGITSIFDEDAARTPSATQYAGAMMREDLSSVGKVIYDALSTTANMAPSIAAGAAVGAVNPVVGQWVGASLMGASAGGNAYAQALQEGRSESEAITMGVLVGTSEAVLEKFVGGVIPFGKADNIIEGFASAAKRIAGKIAVEGTSEFVEEGLQSVLEQTVLQYMAYGEGASFDSIDWEDVIYNASLGFLTGGVISGTRGVVAEGYRNSQLDTSGKTVIDNNGMEYINTQIEELKQLRAEGNIGTYGKKAIEIAEKLGDNPTPRQIALLSEAVERAVTERNYNEIYGTLTDSGYSKSDAGFYAEDLAKATGTASATRNGNTFSGITENSLNPESGAYDETLWNIAMNTVWNNESDITKRSKGFAEATRDTKAEASAIAQAASVEEAYDSNHFAAQENEEYKGKTTYTDDEGNTSEVAILGVDSIKDGTMMLKLEGGEVVDASDVSFSSEGEALVYSAMADLGVSTKTADAIIREYNASEVDAGVYALGIEDAYKLGRINAPLSQLPEDSLARRLSDHQRKMAYNLGKADVAAADTSRQSAIDKKMASVKAKTGTKEGKVIYELPSDMVDKSGNIIEANLSDVQRASIVGIKALAELSPINFHVFRSEKIDGQFVATINGEVVDGSPNGVYMAGTNDIWIDLNAGDMGEGTMLWTAAHEISHYIRERSPAKWKKIADYVISEISKKDGTSVSDLLSSQEAKVKKRTTPGTKTESEITDEAYEELISDALSEMLTDGNVVNFLAELKQKDKGLWQTIKDAIADLLKRWGEVLGVYNKELRPGSREAEAIRSMEKAYKKLQKMFAEAFAEANKVEEARQLVGTTGDVDIDGNPTPHKLSDRSMIEGAGLRFVPTKTEGKAILEYRVEDKDGNPVKKVTSEMIKDSPLGKLVGAAVEGDYISKDDAKVQYEFLVELVNMCIDYKGMAPIWETAGTLVFSAIKNNADKQYGKTIDFSTVCKKTQAIVDAMSEAMLRLGRGLTRSEVETIYLEVGKAGEETPCPVCYVFSRWMGIGGILDQMYRFQEKYVSMPDKNIISFMEGIERVIDARANTPDKNGKLKSAFFDKDGNIKQGQVIADLKNKASSKAASALKKLASNSDIELQIQELEAVMQAQDEKGRKATLKKIAKLKVKLVDVSAVESTMKEANDEIEDYEAYQWLTRTLMVMDDASGKWIRNSKFKSVPKEVIFDLNKGDEFASNYPLSWAFRTGKGASAGKAITPYADARVGETIQGIAKADIKDIQTGLDLNPFLNGDEKTQGTLLKNAREKQKRQNLIGGQRYQSTSDFRYEYGSDYLITFLEMQAIGAKVQLYTKVIEAVDFLATVGAECNLSVMPLGDGFITLEDGTKKLVYSSVTGINGEAAIAKSQQYDNVQLILVGISDEHIRLALEGSDVTFVIPFHGSGQSVHQIATLMNLLKENLDVTTARDYTPVQSDHDVLNPTKEQKASWTLRKKIIMGKAGTITAAEHQLLDSNEFLKDLYRRFYLDESAEEHGVALTEDQANQIFPYEYWDKSLTYAEADENGRRFIAYCESVGKVPRFSGVNSKGESVGFGDFTKNKGYWKLLIDRRMYNNVYDENGNWTGYGDYHNPKAIDVTNFKSETIDPAWGTAHYGNVMAKANDPKKTNSIVDAALAQINKPEMKLSDRNAHQNPDIRYSERNTDSNRSLLANALETTVQNEVEAKAIAKYKEQIAKFDAEQEKLDKLNAEIRELSFSEGKRDTKRLQELRDEAIKTSNRINIYDRRLFKLEATKTLDRVLEREKAKARKLQKQKDAEVLREYKGKTKETREKREAVKKLQKLVLDTGKWVSYPGKNVVKVPDVLKEPYAEFLESIDMSSKRLLGGGEATQNDMKIASAMDSLATAIEQVKTAQNPTADVTDIPKDALDSGYLDLPVNFVANLRTMTENIKKLMTPGSYVIGEMTAKEVKEISKLIRTLNHAIKEMSTLYSNLRFARVEEIGDSSISFLEDIGEAKKINAIAGFVSWKNALPYYAFKRFGKAGESIFEELMDGQDKLAFLADEIFKFKDKNWTDKEAKAWGEDTHTIKLPSGNEVTLTTADAMGIYCLSRREQAVPHLLGGGIRVVGQKKGMTQVSDSRTTLTEADLGAIISSLSKRQIEVAEAIQEFMSTTCAEWGNEISMKRFLTREFTEPYYYPIESSDENLPVKDKMAQQADLYRLLNISATKPLTEGANNAVVIRNIFDVFTSHASDMAKLNAFGMPLLDYMKWVNYREKVTNEEGQITTRGVRQAMNITYGGEAFSYVLNLIKDVNGRYNDGGDNAWLMEMTRAAKTAAVGSSLKTAVLQVTSYPRAGLVLSQKSLALGLTKKPQIKKAQQYCGIALWKSFGFYDTNISRSIEDQIKGTSDIKQKLIEWSLKGAELGDALAWGCLWNACEYEVAQTNKSLKVGSEEFNEAVGKKLREVVYATQVVDSTLTRSQIMRKKGGLTQGATSFMSEPTVSANILVDAVFRFNLERRRSGSAKEAWGKTGKYIGKAFAIYTEGQLVAALVEALWDAYRDDDDEEFYKKFLAALKENAILDLNPLNKIPIISDVIEMVMSSVGIGYFSSDNLSTTWLAQTSNAIKSWAEVLGKENTSETVYSAIYNSVRAVSSFVGVSFAGAMREVVDLWNNTAGAYDVTLKIKKYENTDAQNAKLLYDAIVSGDSRQAESLKAQFDDDDAASKALKKVVGDKYKSGEANADTVTQILSDHCEMDSHEIHWLLDEWDHADEEDYSKYNDFYSAVESGNNLKATIRTYLDNGVSEETLAGQITRYFKPLMQKATTKGEQANIKARCLTAYSALGYSRSEKSRDIDAWLKE